MELYRQSQRGLLVQCKYGKTHNTKTHRRYQHIEISDERICCISMFDLFYAVAAFEKPVLYFTVAHVVNLNMSVI